MKEKDIIRMCIVNTHKHAKEICSIQTELTDMYKFITSKGLVMPSAEVITEFLGDKLLLGKEAPEAVANKNIPTFFILEPDYFDNYIEIARIYDVPIMARFSNGCRYRTSSPKLECFIRYKEVFVKNRQYTTKYQMRPNVNKRIMNELLDIALYPKWILIDILKDISMGELVSLKELSGRLGLRTNWINDNKLKKRDTIGKTCHKIHFSKGDVVCDMLGYKITLSADNPTLVTCKRTTPGALVIEEQYDGMLELKYVKKNKRFNSGMSKQYIRSIHVSESYALMMIAYLNSLRVVNDDEIIFIVNSDIICIISASGKMEGWFVGDLIGTPKVWTIPQGIRVTDMDEVMYIVNRLCSDAKYNQKYDIVSARHYGLIEHNDLKLFEIELIK